MPKTKKADEPEKEKFNLQQHVTNQIIEALETGVKPWERAWKSKGGDFQNGLPPIPVNLSSKKRYRGINILMLWESMGNQGFTSRYDFMTEDRHLDYDPEY